MDSKTSANQPESGPNLAFEGFCRLVSEQPALHQALRETPDLDSFLALAVQLGKAHGFDFTSGAVLLALQEKRREWLERWV